MMNWATLLPRCVLCVQSADEREVVAIKCVTKASLNRASTENLLTEIELLKTLKHEHIVELKDFQVTLTISLESLCDYLSGCS